MKKITTFIAGVSIIVVSVVTANAGEIPPVLKAGFEQYIKKGPKAAIESWAKGSAKGTYGVRLDFLFFEVKNGTDLFSRHRLQ